MSVSKIQIAASGPYFSRIILGLWRIADAPAKNKEEIVSLVQGCLQQGISTFDHADIYGGYACEELFGNALRDSSLRGQMQIISKCGIKLISSQRPDHTIKSYDTSKQHIIASVEHSLKMLRTDYLDLQLIHRPDPLMDPDEVAEAFETLKKDGKVLHFGVSNFTPSQFEMLQSRLNFGLVTNQIEISLLNLDPFTNGQIDHCVQRKISPMAWSPFGGGTIFKQDSEAGKRIHTSLQNIGERHNHATVEQILIAWLFKHPSKILAVLGTGKPERIQAVSQAESIQLTREEWFEIWSASTGQEVP